MHEVLRKRLMRRLESLPETQLYQALDYIEFLESKYAAGGVLVEESSGLQKFAENLEDRLRRKAVSPATIREAFQLIASADRVLSGVANAGKQLLGDLNGGEEESAFRSSSPRPRGVEGPTSRQPPETSRGPSEPPPEPPDPRG